MKKIKCPNCNQEINIEDLASANTDIIQDFKSKAKKEHEEELNQKIEQVIERTEKKTRDEFDLKSKQSEKELIRLQEQLRAQEKLKIEQEEIQKEKVAQEINKIKQELEKQSETKERELIHLQEKLKAQENLKQEQEKLQKEKITQEINKAKEELRRQNETKERELIHLQEQLKAQEAIKQEQEKLQKVKIEQEVNKVKEQLIAHYQKEESSKDKELLQQKRDMKILQEKFEKINQERESQELIGEYGEEFIKNMIIQALPKDQIVDVKKGALGADLVVKVKDNNGNDCGSILVEVKNTKQWESKWIGKFQNDLMNSGCDVGLLVSKSQPKKNREEHSFEMYNDNLLSCSFKEIVPIITLLRQRVFELHKLSSRQKNLVTEKDILFNKINSPEFKQRIQVIIDRFGAMKDEYEKQQRDMHRSFERQKQHLGILVQQVIALDETVNTSLLSKPNDSGEED